MVRGVCVALMGALTVACSEASPPPAEVPATSETVETEAPVETPQEPEPAQTVQRETPAVAEEVEPAGDRALAQVIEIISVQLDTPTTAIDPDAPLRSYGADDLDVVELVMAVEEHFEVTIPDDALPEVAQTTSMNALASEVTPRFLAELVEP
ncbi:MAG: phosphopantetheine-binding protein [Myxococcota bacterium]